MKSLKQFIAENNVNSFEGTDTLIINVVVDETHYGLDVDTSNIEGGTILTKYESFIIDGDNIIVGNITINLNDTFMLGFNDEIVENI